MKRLLLSAAFAVGLAPSVWAVDYTLEISMETGPNHIRNIIVTELAAEIEKSSNGRLEMKIFHGASKFKGKNVPTALAQGALDMGIIGNWYLGKIVPDYNMAGLPLFYGRSRQEQYKVWDGDVGQELEQALEKKLNVEIIGRSLDLGFGAMFFTKTDVDSYEDIVGMKMRAPGGAANIARLKAQGVAGVSIPFPDVPQALQRGTVDGLLTTHESVRSAKLWDSGLKYSFSDNHAFYQYLPMVSRKAWDKLPADLQKLVTDTWNSKVDDARDLAAERQASAREDGAKMGMTQRDASPEERAAMRAKLMADQDVLVKELRINPDLVKKALAAMGE